MILPYEKGQRTDLDGYPNFFGNNPVYWRDIFKPEYSELSWAIKMEFCINEKVNHSIATKLCANLLNNRINEIIYSARHNSMTQFCRALFKYENKIKMDEKINAQVFSPLKWYPV